MRNVPSACRAALAASILASLASPVLADTGSDDWIKPVFDARYRFEHVDPDNALHDANANTLRTRIGLETRPLAGWSAHVEIDNVSHLGAEDFNSTRNGNTGYAVVADPDGTAFNQAWLKWAGQHGGATLGRQRVNFDNQRFVGGSAWRQNEQTFDGALVQFTPFETLTATYLWIDQVNTVFGPGDGRANRSNLATLEGDSHLFNVQYRPSKALSLTAYQYRLDFDNAAVTATAPLGTLSTVTTGLRAQGAVRAFSFAAEYARQTDHAGNPWDLDSRYALLELGWKAGPVQLKAGEERLGAGSGEGNRAFQTPLATKHAFQGWADLFLTTPTEGLRDRYAGLSSALFGGTVQAWLHDFDGDRGPGFGRELDLSYQRPLPWSKKLTGLVKFARYRADDARTVDTDKTWVQLQYTY